MYQIPMHDREGKAFLSWVMFLQNRSCGWWVQCGTHTVGGGCIFWRTLTFMGLEERNEELDPDIRESFPLFQLAVA